MKSRGGDPDEIEPETILPTKSRRDVKRKLLRPDGVLFAERANEFLLQLCLTSKSEGRHRETECE